jgi:NADPH:quinone reductase-like Zn-dependent oxidoreductase
LRAITLWLSASGDMPKPLRHPAPARSPAGQILASCPVHWRRRAQPSRHDDRDAIEGSAERASASVLAELAGLIAAGELELPIEATFPLDRVQDAYRRLAEGHVLGKIVLQP